MTEKEFQSILKQRMPDYRIVKSIGAGNFGSVYECERDGIHYAIKIISIPATDQEMQTLLARSDKEAVQVYLQEKVEKYRSEIKLMAELKGNRNIVNIEDYDIYNAENGFWYIVIRMELLTSLTNYVKTHKLNEMEVVQLGIDMCDALTICEKHNIIHRDIKPENIMRHSEGAYKLGDFGVAKQLSKTTAGTIAGTEGFMAPEVYKGQEYNHTSDIYSLGIVLYYYLNNCKMPYVDPSDNSITSEQNAIIRRMNEEDPLPAPPCMNKNLGRIVLKSAMYDKNLRYTSAAEMKADLEKVLCGENVFVDLSERGTISQTGGKKGTRKGTRGGDIETPFGGGSILVTPKGPKNPGKITEHFEDSPTTKKNRAKAIVIGAAALAVVVGGIVLVSKLTSGPEPGTYIGDDGEIIQVLSKEEMEAAYDLGVQYAEQGDYEEAIEELNKVSEYSNKYKDAQKAIAAAINDYKNAIIEKANNALTNKNYENAFAMIDTGVVALGDNAEFAAARDNILKNLKEDYMARAEEYETAEDYTKALECVNFALAYSPNDYELIGVQSRINAANTAKKALDKAAEYRRSLEYSKLFVSLEKAMDSVYDSTTATAKLKIAYDSYMKEYLELLDTQTTDLETVTDYENAVKLYESAVEIFPDDYDLKTELAELKDMKIAVKAVSDAEMYAKQNDYSNLFTSLDKARDSVSITGSAYKKIQSAYDKYKTSFLETLDTQIGTPKTLSEYDTAISLLETAVSVFPEDTSLNYRLQNLKSSKPVNLFEQNMVTSKIKRAYNSETKAITSDSYSNYYQVGKAFTDNYANVYRKATLIQIGNGYYNPYATWVEYDCADYQTLSGTAAIWSETKNYTGHCMFMIVGIDGDDEEYVLFKNAFSSGTRPQTFTVDISKYDRVQIFLYSHKNGDNGVYAYYDDSMGIVMSDFIMTK